MTFVLVLTLIFVDGRLELPHPRFYDFETCNKLGPVMAAWLTQDGVRVEWKCVNLKQESPSKP